MASVTHDPSMTFNNTQPSAAAAEPTPNTTSTSNSEARGAQTDLPPPSSQVKAEDKNMDRLVSDMRRLQLEIDRVRRERDDATESARFATVEAERLRSFQQGTYAASGAYSNERRSKLKASDLPKFYGKDTEDVGDWIEKVSAITTYSQARDSELLKLLPLLLNGNASEWFATLGEAARAQLSTWELWKAALRNAFYLPDHEMRKRMMCRNRMLKKTETFADKWSSYEVDSTVL
jgi:hypothetical protein